MNTTQRARVARALHRAGYHDLAEDVEDGDVSPAAAIRAVKREGAAAEFVSELEAIEADPPADTPPSDPPSDPPPPADTPPDDPPSDPPSDPPPPADTPPDDPPNPPAPKGPEPADTHWLVRKRGGRKS